MQNHILYKETLPGFWVIVLQTGFTTKHIGKLHTTSGVFERRRIRAKHLHRKTNSIAFNYSLMQSDKIKIIKLSLDNEPFYIAREYLLRVGEVYRYKKQGFELQIFVNLNYFSRTPAAALSKLNEQPKLFEEAPLC